MEFIIADDHVLFREALAEYLRRYLPICHVEFVDDFFEAYKKLEKGKRPDVLILDYNMHGMDRGLGIKKIKKDFPDQKVALMSGVAETHDVRDAIDSGAVGYFPKTLSGKDFISGITQIVEGDVFVPISASSGQLVSSYKAGGTDCSGKGQNEDVEHNKYATQKSFELSKRELQILQTLLKGMTNREIAHKMEIKEVTVKMHVSRICQKLGVKSRTQAVIKARDLGFRED